MTTTKNEPRNPAVLSTDGLCAMLKNAAAADRLAFELEQQARPMADRMAFVGMHLCESAASEIERLQNDVKRWQALADDAARLAEIAQNRNERAERLGLVHNAS